MIYLFASERQDQIRSVIDSKGSITIKELCKRFKESRMTLWRDLKVLEEEGFIRRIYGGAITKQISHPFEPSFEVKELTALKEKKLIAQYAAENLVEDNQTISLGAGSTLIQMIPYLKQNNLTFFTNGLRASMLAIKIPSITRVGVSGGDIRRPALVFVGPEAEDYFRAKNVDIVFLSGTGITLDRGITDPHIQDVRIKKAMMQNAKKIIFLMDSSKIGKVSVQETISLNKIDLLLIDDKAPKDFINDLVRNEVKFKIIGRD